MSGQGESLASVTPDQQRITIKNNRKKTPSSYVLRKEPIGYTVSSRKISQEDTVIDEEKGIQHKTYQTFVYKEYYEGDTNENNRYTDDSRTSNGDCLKKWT